MEFLKYMEEMSANIGYQVSREEIVADKDRDRIIYSVEWIKSDVKPTAEDVLKFITATSIRAN